MKLIKEFEYKLSSQIKYQFEGDHFETDVLCLTAPSDSHRKIASKISQDLMRAFMSHSENSSKKNEQKTDNISIGSSDDKETITKEAIIMILYSSKIIDIVEFKEKFRELLLSQGICSLNGDVYLSNGHLQQIDIRETDDLMGEYISNFLLPSFLSQKKN